MAAPSFKIEDWHVIQFTKNVEMLLQQKTPRLLGCVTQGSYTGKAAQVVLQFGDTEMKPLPQGSWKDDTAWEDIQHFQRWVIPSDFAKALAVADQDQLRMLVDPRSPYAEAIRAAYARLVDDTIIAAALGAAKTGPYDNLQSTALPTTQVIADGGGGLTIEKLIEAREKLLAAGNDPGEPRYFACSEHQLSDLLKNTKVQSADYNTVKALVQGDIDTFVGFKFISTERLAPKAPATGPRQCFAWVKSGLHFATWNGFEMKTSERPDKNYVWQLYARATIGATRTNEKKVLQVNCAEA